LPEFKFKIQLYMILLLFTGLSGSGKTTISQNVRKRIIEFGYKVEVIDGDIYRNIFCKDLGFTKDDRIESIKRLFFIGKLLVRNEVVVILSIINPYAFLRTKLKKYDFVREIYIYCPIEILIQRDVKGLYRRALLKEGNPERINYFSGVSDIYDVPTEPDLILFSETESIKESSDKLIDYILKEIRSLTPLQGT